MDGCLVLWWSSSLFWWWLLLLVVVVCGEWSRLVGRRGVVAAVTVATYALRDIKLRRDGPHHLVIVVLLLRVVVGIYVAPAAAAPVPAAAAAAAAAVAVVVIVVVVVVRRYCVRHVRELHALQRAYVTGFSIQHGHFENSATTTAATPTGC
jgi:hypothetical protein